MEFPALSGQIVRGFSFPERPRLKLTLEHPTDGRDYSRGDPASAISSLRASFLASLAATADLPLGTLVRLGSYRAGFTVVPHARRARHARYADAGRRAPRRTALPSQEPQIQHRLHMPRCVLLRADSRAADGRRCRAPRDSHHHRDPTSAAEYGPDAGGRSSVRASVRKRTAERLVRLTRFPAG